MKNFNFISLAAGLLIVTGLFLPAITFMGMEMSLSKSAGGVRNLFIIMAISVICASFYSKKWLSILNIIFGIIILFLSLKYMADARDAGTKPGSGIWCLLAGGALALGISVKQLFSKRPRRLYVSED